MERKTPPLVINTPEDGFLRVGLNTDAKTSRPDQVQLAGGCGASLRIFDDGGWELRSVNRSGKPNKKGCNIIEHVSYTHLRAHETRYDRGKRKRQ